MWREDKNYSKNTLASKQPGLFTIERKVEAQHTAT